MSATQKDRCPACGETRPLLSIKSAADLVDVNRKTIYRWIHAGLLEFRRLPSGSIRIFEESLLKVPRGYRKKSDRESRRTDKRRGPSPVAP